MLKDVKTHCPNSSAIVFEVCVDTTETSEHILHLCVNIYHSSLDALTSSSSSSSKGFRPRNMNKANLRDLIAATGLVISNSIQIVNFSARVTVKFDG